MKELKELVVEFQLYDKKPKKELLEEFKDLEIIESNAFTGADLLTIILPASIVLVDKVLNFYVKNKQTTKGTIKVGKDEINLSGYSTKEILELTQDGSLDKLKELLNKKK
ncbi:hypothetical protein [Membranihabitans maritimus]|uniref:hypothetical protein n=1 Tax=Membranihabitans maritimus TaxID=2904244 RepID=UPI001F3082BC|nr:hypothetical protein [Membranihabitans maritimus]